MTTLLKTRRKAHDQGLEFRTWMRYILIRARRTFEELAQLSGVPLSTVKAIAAGRRKEPNAVTRAKLERAIYVFDAEFLRKVERDHAELAQESGEPIEKDSDNIDAKTIRLLIDAYVAGTRKWAERNGRPWPGPILKTRFWKQAAQWLKESGIGPDEFGQFFLQAFEHPGLAQEKEVIGLTFDPHPRTVIRRILGLDED